MQRFRPLEYCRMGFMYFFRILLFLLLFCAGGLPLSHAWADEGNADENDSGSSDSGSGDSGDSGSGSDDSGGSNSGDKDSENDSAGSGGSQTDDDGDHSGKGDIKTADDQRRATDAVKNGNAATLKEILAKVRKTYRGDVVRVSLRGSGSNLTYRIKLLNENNRLIEVQVNAVSRQITRVKGL